MFVIHVTFDLRPERSAEFLSLIRANAATSLADEPGCRQFDVCIDPRDPTVVLLYEVYDSEADFEGHLATAHFRAFDAATADMVRDKQVRRLSRLETEAI